MKKLILIVLAILLGILLISLYFITYMGLLIILFGKWIIENIKKYGIIVTRKIKNRRYIYS